MPRKNPLPQREGEICLRLRMFRNVTNMSRVAFARKLGWDSSVLASREHCRSPLRYEEAFSLCWTFSLNPMWLFSGEGLVYDLHNLPSADELKTSKSALFSEVFSEILKGGVPWRREALKTSDPIGARIAFENIFRNKLRDWLVTVRDEELGEFSREFVRSTVELLASLPTDTPENVDRRRQQIELRRSLTARPNLSEAATEKQTSKPEYDKINLTNKAESATSLPMQSTVPKSWKELRADLQALTAERGGKSQLAEDLQVSRQVVTSWLKKKKANEPSADFTLRLVSWVAEHKGKQ